MKTISRFTYFVAVLVTIQFGPGCVVELKAQQTVPADLNSPIYGKLMLVGPGELSSRVLATFAYLAGEGDGSLVILGRGKARDTGTIPQWQELIGNVTLIKLDKSISALAGKDFSALQAASAVWLTDDFSKALAGSVLNDELKALLHRGGIVGGQDAAAESLATLVKDGNEMRDGFNLLPNSFIWTGNGGEEQFIETANSLPGRVAWKIPPEAAVVIHNGRQISVIGDPEITLRTAANGDWPERVASYGPPIDDLPYTTDLVSWNRSARARLNDLFPPLVAPVPEVPAGALVIVGGHGYPDGMWERVVEFAGGQDANYVCLAQSPASTGAKMLRGLGCRNVAVHVVRTGVDGIGQGNDDQLLEDLEKADAVYFGGGRTYKFMDAYLNTKAHILMNEVLKRGGIILGGSAGAQIQGDFLVRGDPTTNSTLWMEGNDVGLGFIKGVIIDVHFRERGRENTLPSLLLQHPQMLGIGIDETTAIWVQGSIAEVLGPHSVTFYNLRNAQNQDASSDNAGDPVILMAGEKYDLRQGKPLDQ